MENIRIKKILVANRGEIAVRIIRTLKRLRIESVAIYADNDRNSFYCRLADEAFSLGSGTLANTYLNVDKIIETALKTGAQAIHPGYGFLSENPELAEACEKNNIVFIGPSSDIIRLMGNKIEARKIAVENNVPVLFGLTGSTDEVLSQADDLPYPVIVKAAAGGGGKGMHIVRESGSLKSELERASREAEKYFGDGTVFVEQYIENPRHIEVQILADNYGNTIHLFERECTIQRRYQKIIEESPSPTLTNDVRKRMLASAVNLADKIGYSNAGTVEFLVDEDLNFYFLEMNTRIQVEHPVTEERMGIDIVEEQIRIADYQRLHFNQDDIKPQGHAIEMRVYAEDTENGFLPSPGTISLYHEPQQHGVRIDSMTDGECYISPDYDPMIAKVICHAKTREAAIETAGEVLSNFVIHGIRTNIDYLYSITKNKSFLENRISTNFCVEHARELCEAMEERKCSLPIVDLAACFLLFDIFAKRNFMVERNVWEDIGYWRFNMKTTVNIDENVFPVDIVKAESGIIRGKIEDDSFEIKHIQTSDKQIKAVLNDRTEIFYCSVNVDNTTNLTLHGITFECARCDQLNEETDYSASEEYADKSLLVSPMPGRVAKISVSEGDVVERGQVMLVVEAMKMENNITASARARVRKINITEGQMVDNKMQLLELDSVL